MRAIALCLLAGALALGCSKDKAAKKNEGSGSAATPAGSGSASAAAAKPPAPRTATAEDKLKRYQECLDAFNAGKDEVFTSCFAADSMREQIAAVPEIVAKGPAQILELALSQRAAFPDLNVKPLIIVASGNQIAALLYVSGTNTGEAGGMKPTGKKLGVFEAELAVMNDDGTIAREQHYVDQLTIFHQLGLLESESAPSAASDGGPADKKTWTLVSKGDERERANQAVVQQLVEAIGNKKPAAVGPLVANDIQFVFHGDKQQVADKKAYLKWAQETMKSTKESKVEIKGVWAAGNYVVVSDIFSATPPDSMKAAKGKQIETHVVHFAEVVDGKVKQHHIFANRLMTAVQLGLVDPESLMKQLSGAD